MRKIFKKRIVSLFLVLTVLFSLCSCGQPKHENAVTPKVILFIGDGMGPNHIYNAEYYFGEEMYFSSFEIQTMVDTDSLTGLTDSAAAATAMATGTRVSNNILAKDMNGDLTSITELAKQNEYGAGVVTSDKITGATPSGFSAHSSSRNDSAQILLSQRYNKMDLLLGSGYYPVYETKFTEQGWTWVTSFDELSVKAKNKRYVATFEDVVPNGPTADTPTLTQLATFAVEYMEKHYPTGYFLMIEGAKIDKASHSNDIEAMCENMLDFSNAIEAVDEILCKNKRDYSIIVTADHETGALSKATEESGVTDDLYGSSNHTRTDVNLFYKSTVAGVPEVLGKELILNTDIFLLCRYLLAI